MIIEARTAAGRVIGRMYCCHGCGARSPLMKGDPPRLPVRFGRAWVEREEPHYTDKGNHTRGRFVVNYYCPTCVLTGMNARVIATVLRKLALQARRTRDRAQRLEAESLAAGD